MGAGCGLRPVFAVGHEQVEAFFAIETDKVISWHDCILSKTFLRVIASQRSERGNLPFSGSFFQLEIATPPKVHRWLAMTVVWLGSALRYNIAMNPDPEFNILKPQPLLIVISGPSGAGKDTVVQLMQERGMLFHFVVTANTRPKREEEVHGVDYFFVSKEEFARMIEEDELIEYASVYSDYKGIPKQQVREALASGKDVVMRLDVQGAETVRKLAPEALLIFLTTGSEEELVERLKARKTETPEELALRIATARKELKRVEAFDYVIVNHDNKLDETVDTVLAIIDAEHHRVKHREVTL